MKAILPIWIALLCLFGTSVIAQKKFHNSEGFAKFTEDTSVILVQVKPSMLKSAFIDAHKNNYDAKHTDADVTALSIPASSSRKAYIQQLESEGNVNFVYHGLWNNGVPFIPTGEIVLELKYGQTIEETFKIAGVTGKLKERENPVTTNENARGIVLPDSVRPMQIFITSKDDAFDVANKIFETGKVRYAMPDFYIPIKTTGLSVRDPLYMSKLVEPIPVLKNHLLFTFPPPPAAPNDPAYNDQINLTHMGKLDSAWLWYDYVNGKAFDGIIICDEGIDMGTNAHPDLNPIGGYNVQSPVDQGAPIGSLAGHGTACGGVAAAIRNNGILMAGIASGALVKPVSTVTTSITLAQVAANLHWAWASGSYKIISNSWTCGAVSPIPAISAEINSGMAFGSYSGNGNLWVFSSGANTGGPVNFPNNLPGVLTVGAVDDFDVREPYSNFGSELDLVATVGAAGIPSLDRKGTLGYTANDQNSSFAGTSAACPQVAGAAHILLAVVQSYTTQAELFTALTTGATDITSTGVGFDNQTGFGHVNVLRSLARLMNLKASITAYSQSNPATRMFEMNVPDPWLYTASPYTYNWSVNPAYATLSTVSGWANKRYINVTKVPGAPSGTVPLTCNYGPIDGIWITKTYNLTVTAAGISRIAPTDTTIGITDIRSQDPSKLTENTNLQIVAGPVPAHNTVAVSLEDEHHRKTAFSRIDMNSLTASGTRQFSKNYPQQTYSTSINLAGIAPGVYVLTVYSGDHKITKKITVF